MKLKNMADFLETLTDRQLVDGCVWFRVPNEQHIHDLMGEIVYGWVTPEDKEKYQDKHYQGKISAILCGPTLAWCTELPCFTEVVLQCHGGIAPTLDPEWVMEHLVTEG